MKRSPKGATRAKNRLWSAKVTKHSNALDLERDVFKSKDPRKIAVSLKRSAAQSARRKGTPYQSAMSMLNFYINRAGEISRKSRSEFSRTPKTNCATFLAVGSDVAPRPPERRRAPSLPFG